MRNLVANSPIKEIFTRCGEHFLVQLIRTIEERSVEVLEAIVTVPSLVWLDSSNIWVISVNIWICLGDICEWVMSQEMLMAPLRRRYQYM